jgi:1-acyl-sn-glycerol-3-phosphate acyltransferase
MKKYLKKKKMFYTYQIIKVLVKFFFCLNKAIKSNLVDWVIVNMLAIRQGSLGHVRYVLKNDLKWIPFYGFYFEQVK